MALSQITHDNAIRDPFFRSSSRAGARTIVAFNMLANAEMGFEEGFAVYFFCFREIW